MRLLLDTHAFLWLITGDARLAATTRSLIDAAESVLLSVASVWEAEIKRAAGHLDVPPVADAAERVDVSLLAVTGAHATAAAQLPLHHHDPFDRMLVAQAMNGNFTVIGSDRIFDDYEMKRVW